MRLPAVGRYSLHFEGLTAVLVQFLIKMKYALFFLLVVVAMAAAAPQFLYGTGFGAAGYITPTLYGGARTLVAGPTVVNTPYGFGGRYISPGYVGGIY